MKLKITTLALALALTSISFADAAPATCPAVNAIQAAGLMSADAPEDGAYAVGQINTYGTPETWAFAILVPQDQVNNQSEAMAKAKSELPTLSSVSAPMSYEGKWICLYTTASGYQAGAITPFSFNAMSKKVKFKK